MSPGPKFGKVVVTMIGGIILGMLHLVALVRMARQLYRLSTSKAAGFGADGVSKTWAPTAAAVIKAARDYKGNLSQEDLDNGLSAHAATGRSKWCFPRPCIAIACITYHDDAQQTSSKAATCLGRQSVRTD
jgi:hypothetical protein